MPKKHTVVPAVAAAPLPARFIEILAALPMVAWVEDSQGKILANNFSGGRALSPRAPQPPLGTPSFHSADGAKRRPNRQVETWRPQKITSYPLPPITGCLRGLRLVTLISGENENASQSRVISTLLALLLDAARPDDLQLTPQQRDIYRKLSLGFSYKETAYDLGISHNTLLVQLTLMRKRLGDGIIPRLRRHPVASKHRQGKFSHFN